MAKPRNTDIRKAYQRELNLSTKSIHSKKAYVRKPKHPPKGE